jgi:myo-inositol-1(or 4)-monophosphatase
MKTNSLAELLEFITETAYQAGRLTLGYYQTNLQTEYKPDNSPVTIADRKSEELIRSRIAAAYPGHAVIGEEYGRDAGTNASHCWIIDPIDGTKSFIRGVPLYAVLIGLEIDGQPAAGAAYFPALDEMICAAAGLGCWWNGRRARVSPQADLSRAFLTTTSVQAFHRLGRQAAFERLLKRCYFQAGWSDAYGYLLVATGRAEIMLDPIMSVWDCAPFLSILSEAGGYFGDWRGNPTIHAPEALATNAALLPQVLEILNAESKD